eukprot:2936482-Rhodomonas_salina.1
MPKFRCFWSNTEDAMIGSERGCDLGGGLCHGGVGDQIDVHLRRRNPQSNDGPSERHLGCSKPQLVRQSLRWSKTAQKESSFRRSGYAAAKVPRSSSTHCDTPTLS